MAVRMYLSLASDKGDRLGHLVRGVNMMMSYGKECRIRRLSSLYEAQPVADRPPGLFAVVEADTEMPPNRTLDFCQEVEWSLGRAHGEEQGTLDVDVLLFGNEVSTAPRLTLPHPWVFERAVIGVALTELKGAIELPGGGRLGEGAGAATQAVRTFMPAEKFRQICRQGQRDGAEGAEVMGEWPSLDSG